MAPIDSAGDTFRALVGEVTSQHYWDSIQSEEDTRMKIIDRIFVDVLGWPRELLSLESTAGNGYIDYLCKINGEHRLVIEAKKQGRSLGLRPDHANRFFKLNGPVFNTEAAKEGIKQGIIYGAFRGTELACLTNGHQWVVFRARGPEGRDTLDAHACVFGSLTAVQAKFQEFYELLSYQHVSQHTYRAIFRQADGTAFRTHAKRTVAIHPESKRFLPADKLSADLDRIMVSFFRELSDQDDEEARRACFVTSEESALADQGLSRISEDLRDKVRSFKGSSSEELTDTIRRVQELKQNALVLLVGTKGAGKSTFIDRFFADVLPKGILDDCVIIRIDLEKSGGTGDVARWLDTHFLEIAEKAAFGSEPPRYEDLQGMFFGEYRRWMTGPMKPLYESDKEQYKIKFGDHVETYRRDRPYDYIKHLLIWIVQGFAKLPCLVFDNADHFTVSFQEAVFNYAHSLYVESLCLTILPITDTTSWQLSKQGPLQSFFTESFFLPTPAAEQVLKRRIEYIEKKVSEEAVTQRPEVGRGYFFSRGIRLEIDNIRKFAACLQTVFINTGAVADWIGRLANHDVRRCLQLSREVVASPYIPVSELLRAELSKTAMGVMVEDVKLALLRGKNDIYYHTTQSFVQNLFFLDASWEGTPLLGVRILQSLDGAYRADPENDRRYVVVDQLADYLYEMGIERSAVVSCVGEMVVRGLVLCYNPTQTGIDGGTRVQIAPSGVQHLTWACHDWIYLEAMAEVTPMFDAEVCETIKTLARRGTADARRGVIERFVGYLVNEDSMLCSVPEHADYADQKRVRKVLQQQCVSLRSFGALASNPRFHRMLGRVKAWKGDFGFIGPVGGDADVFVHVSQIRGGRSGEVAVGQGAEFEIANGPKGLQGIDVVLLDMGGGAE